jgi:hypothetical protein
MCASTPDASLLQCGTRSTNVSFVVRLSRNVIFEEQEMWKNAALYTANAGGGYGAVDLGHHRRAPLGAIDGQNTPNNFQTPL